MLAGEPLLKVEGLTRHFPGVVALADATLEAGAGEAHGICGKNGAGKSTLIEALTGAHWPTPARSTLTALLTTAFAPELAGFPPNEIPRRA
jgi:ribose transport system ATP-binding protein